MEVQRSAQLFNDQEDQRLAEVYAPCITLILQLRSAVDFGEPETLRDRVRDLIARVEREAQRLGAPAEDIEQATFAIVAFLDETILSSDWPYRDQWIARPLQLEMYDRYDAGEAFFTRLQTLLDQPARSGEVLEVYYLCMALGFKGQYQLHDQARLRVLIDEAEKALRSTPGYREATELSPHGTPRGQVASEVRRKLPPWVIIAAAAAIGLVVYLGLYVYMSGASEDVTEQIDTVRSQQQLAR